MIEDIRAETIRELEALISDCSRSKISEYDLWTKADGKQEVKAYLRNLKVIVQDILADLGFKNLQYLWFEYEEVNGERRYGGPVMSATFFSCGAVLARKLLFGYNSYSACIIQ